MAEHLHNEADSIGVEVQGYRPSERVMKNVVKWSWSWLWLLVWLIRSIRPDHVHPIHRGQLWSRTAATASEVAGRLDMTSPRVPHMQH